jgi:hypothetical protein
LKTRKVMVKLIRSLALIWDTNGSCLVMEPSEGDFVELPPHTDLEKF